MVALAYRMGAGYPGDITRHQFQSAAAAAHPTTPPTGYGQAVVVDAATQTVRPMTVGDTAPAVYGITVRMFPGQMPAAPLPYGGTPLGTLATPPSPPQPIDILRQGFISVSVVGNPVKGGTVYVWTAASAAPHVQGGFEAANPGASGVALDSKTCFEGVKDGSGVVEIGYNI